MNLVSASGADRLTISGDTIPTSEIAALSEDVASAQLTDLCDIERRTPTDDGQGTVSEVWAVVYADVPCRLYKPRQQREAVQGAVLNANTVYTLDVPLGTDVQQKDRAVKDTLRYEIIDTNTGETNATVLSSQVVRVTR